MKLKEIANLLSADVFVGQKLLEEEVEYAFSSDLMSDVLASSTELNAKSILLTGLSNYQVIRTAEMMDIPVVVFVRGKMPTEDMLELAIDNDMVIMRTKLSMYNASGILYQNGLTGVDV